MDGQRERDHLTAASAAYLNKELKLTPGRPAQLNSYCVGLLRAALLPGVAQGTSRPCPSAPGHALRRHTLLSQARRQARPQTAGVLQSAPHDGSGQAGGAARASSGMRGCRGGRSPQLQRGWYRALARGGSDAHAYGWRPCPGGKSVVRLGGISSCVVVWSACPVLRGACCWVRLSRSGPPSAPWPTRARQALGAVRCGVAVQGAVAHACSPLVPVAKPTRRCGGLRRGLGARGG